MTTSANDLPMIGQVNKNLFWGILVVALLALTGMVTLASRGLVAMAATIPVPFSVQSTTIVGTNFKLYPGVSGADNTTPVAVSQLDASITGMVITKSFSLFGHTVTVNFSAGNSGTPVTATGLTMDANSLNIGSASFSNMTLSAAGTGGLEQDASNATLNNASITSPYLAANSITLPNLSVSLSIS